MDSCAIHSMATMYHPNCNFLSVSVPTDEGMPSVLNSRVELQWFTAASSLLMRREIGNHPTATAIDTLLKGRN
jgi:hypothetical protein